MDNGVSETLLDCFRISAGAFVLENANGLGVIIRFVPRSSSRQSRDDDDQSKQNRKL